MKKFFDLLAELCEELAGKLGTAATAAAVALALLSTATPARAQMPQTIPILEDGIASITVSNTIPYTNTLSPGSYGTNIVGLGWTTSSGSNIVATATNGTRTKLTRGVNTWADWNGTCPTNANLSCTFTAGSGNITTNTLIFVPLYDGTNESSAAGDSFIWSITANGATTNTIATNNPISRWPGAQRFRCKVIAAGTNAANGQFTVLKLNLNGFPR